MVNVAQPTWNSPYAFVLAAAGSAVGLGNVWRFPWLVGEYGGAVFVLIYLMCVFFICHAIMFAEVAIGRIGRGSAYDSVANVVKEYALTKTWLIIGAVALISSGLILAFYTVVGGWVFKYVVYSFSLVTPDSAQEATAEFAEFSGNQVRSIGWHLVFSIVCLIIVAQGVNKGLERAMKLLMPMLISLMLLLMIYSLFVGETAKGVAFLFSPDWSKLNLETVRAAMGQAFFSLSLGMGMLVTFGSYTKEKSSMSRDLLVVAIIDTSIAMIAALMLFPLLFQANIEPSAGPSLVFVTLSYAFGQMPMGEIAAMLFYFALSLAAITSGIALIEPVIHFCVARGVSRIRSVLFYGSFIIFAGILSAVDNDWIGIFSTATDYLLLIGTFFIAMLVGWYLPSDRVQAVLSLSDSHWRVFRAMIKYIAPGAVGILLIANAYDALAKMIFS